MNLFLEKRVWWSYIELDIQELLKEVEFLINNAQKWDKKFHDYAFVVFPGAKAYEGFLKKVFLDMGFIGEEDYYGRKFRIGKALNPNLEKFYRNESVYDKIVLHCGGKNLADKLWETWKFSRNLIFHWFPKEKNAITFPEAQERILMILDAMDETFKECKI